MHVLVELGGGRFISVPQLVEGFSSRSPFCCHTVTTCQDLACLNLTVRSSRIIVRALKSSGTSSASRTRSSVTTRASNGNQVPLLRLATGITMQNHGCRCCK